MITRTYVLIRHAEALDRPAFTGPRNERPLTPRGHEAASFLAHKLSHLNIRAVYASPATRCRQTAAYIAEVSGVEMIVDHALFEGRHIELPQTEHTCAIVAHGDNIPTFLESIGVHCPELGTSCAWVIQMNGAIVVKAEYIRS